MAIVSIIVAGSFLAGLLVLAVATPGGNSELNHYLDANPAMISSTCDAYENSASVSSESSARGAIESLVSASGDFAEFESDGVSDEEIVDAILARC